MTQSAPRKLRCPMCRTHLDLEALVMDEAQDALMQHVYRLPQDLRLALIPYLALFRPDERDPTPERSLRLAREVQAIEGDPGILAAALSRTREAVLAKWQRAGVRRPLKDHAYLLPVIETVRNEWTRHHVQSGQPTDNEQPLVTRSQTAQGVAALEQMKHA